MYLDPPDKAMVLAVDEKSQMQALDRTAPMLPIMPGTPERRTHDYVRYGITSLFAALDIATGKVIGQHQRRHRHQEFLRFLKTIDALTPAELDLHLICDNYATHETPAIKKWLAGFKLSTDPFFVDKVHDVAGVYLDPPERALVFCVDSGSLPRAGVKSQIQALDRSQPVLRMMPGVPQRMTSDYVRAGTTTLFAALDVASGKVICSLHRRHRAEEFKKFLIILDKQTPPGLDLHLVLDNYATPRDRRSRPGCRRTRGSICTSPPPDRPGSIWSSSSSPG